VVDVLVVPQRLEDAVGETEDEEVLDRFLAEVVVDAEDRPLAEDLEDLLVQLLRRRQVPAERFLDHDAMAFATARDHPGAPQVLDDGDEVVGRSGAVEEAVAGGTKCNVDPLQLLLQLRK